MEYHVPVMLNECLKGLNIKPEGYYVDVTFGGGGHSKAILEKINGGKLYGIDQDQEAEVNAANFEKSKFEFIQGNFRYFNRYLKLYGIQEIDGLIADLGISSHQIDKPERGFSTRFEANLDMRMDADNGGITAYQIVNTYAMKELQRVLSDYGEIRNARTLAEDIVRSRINQPITTTIDLKSVLQKHTIRKKENKYYAQVFQALRIEVNDEMSALRELLTTSAKMIRSGGRIVVMSYHSLEDRLVKNFFNSGDFSGNEEKDIYGNSEKPFDPINRKALVANDSELLNNPRSRSARLRIAEKR